VNQSPVVSATGVFQHYRSDRVIGLVDVRAGGGCQAAATEPTFVAPSATVPGIAAESETQHCRYADLSGFVANRGSALGNER
jgi:hypothetical protein